MLSLLDPMLSQKLEINILVTHRGQRERERVRNSGLFSFFII